MSHANSAARERLKAILGEKSFKKGHFVLASGAISDHFFDVKITLLDPEGANLAADLILDRISHDIDAVGGLELGACPIVSAVCVKSYPAGKKLKTFYVRKAKKDRGTNKLIEGCTLEKGNKVILVEDVTTTGGSVMDAIAAVQEEGAIVVKVLSIVDRLQGARENLEKKGIALDSLFTKHDFM
jgi:orotate phosphoribosyltransferase